MEAVKTLAMHLCVSLIFFGVVLMLCPEGVMKKSFKTFISTAIIAVIVVSADGIASAVKNIDLDITYKATQKYTEEMSQTVESMNINAVESSVKNLILQKLSSYDIQDLEILVSANISDDNSISITNVEIVCPKGYESACSRALNELGLEGSVTERE